MEAKYKSNLSNMEQKEFSKLSNNETTVIKPADKGGRCSDSFNRSLPKAWSCNIYRMKKHTKTQTLASRGKYRVTF